MCGLLAMSAVIYLDNHLTNATNDKNSTHLLPATSNKDILLSKPITCWLTNITDILHEVRANPASYTDMIEHSWNLIATHCPLSLLMDYAALNQRMDEANSKPDTQRLSVSTQDVMA